MAAFSAPGVGHSQRQSEKNENSIVTCKISTPDVRWRLNDTTATISVEVELQSKEDIVVVPSVQLTALPKKTDELEPNQYWAPFELESGASTDKWQRLANDGEKQRRSVRLAPSKLSWAPTKSSVWPSLNFARAVPPGEYSLRVKLDSRDFKARTSNEITITILN